MKEVSEEEITYLGQSLILRPDRELRYCVGGRHQETPLHLLRCADTAAEERTAWRRKLLREEVLTLERLEGWFLEGSGIILNPQDFTPFYFTSLTYAQEYKELNFKHVLYGPISICQVKA